MLGSLPSTRPSRLGRRGRDSASDTTKATAAKPAKKAKAPARRKPAPEKVPTVAQAKPQRPKAVRSASQNLAEPAKKSAGQRKPAAEPAPSGTELVTTVVQAAGELASVGLSIGGQIVKRAVERLPKP